jgi:hypothetical protein
MSNALIKIESEVNQQCRNKKDAEKRHNLKEFGEFIETEYLWLKRIRAKYDQYKKEKEKVYKSGQAR